MKKVFEYIGIVAASAFTFVVMAYALSYGIEAIYENTSILDSVYYADWFEITILVICSIFSCEVYSRGKIACGIR